MSELLSIGDAATRLSVSPWTLRAHLKSGGIHAVRIGRRVLISNAEVERLAAHGLPSIRRPKSIELTA